MESKAAESQRAPTAWLLVACAVALGMRLFSGSHLDIDHNGAWHVFIAKNLSREWATLAHPPLFLVLLKACDALGHSLLVYRAVPILAGVVSVFLVGRVLSKLGTLPVVAFLGALTVACAQTATVISLAVESYTLAVVFILASFLCALDLVGAGEGDGHGAPPLKSRVGFALFASLALLSHFFTALYLAALAGAVLLAALLVPDRRRALVRALPHRWKADLVMLAVPALVWAALYGLLVRRWKGIPLIGTFDAVGGSLGAYLAAGMKNTVNMFAPVTLGRAAVAGAVLAGFVAVVIGAPATERSSSSSRMRRLLPALLFSVLLALVAILGAASRYPFGGEMRHQFLLFLFALLAGFVAFDRLIRSRSPNARRALVVLAVAAIAADVALNARGYVTPPVDILQAKRGIYRKHLAGARTVHLDRFSVVGLMMEYYGRDWRYLGSDPADALVRRYAVSLGSERLEVVVHRRWWKLDFLDPALYADLAQTWDPAGGECQTVFAVYQNIYLDVRKLTPEKRAEFEKRIPALASAAGFEVHRLDLDDDDVDADLCRNTAAP